MKTNIINDFLDFYLKSAEKSYERMYNTRQRFRDRTVTIITVFLGILGAIIVLSGNEITFLDLFQTKSICYKCVFIIVVSVGMISFLIAFWVAKSEELESQYNRMIYIIKKIQSIDEDGDRINLKEENITVSAVGLAKVDLIRSYSSITNDLIDNIKLLKCIYTISATAFLTAIVLAIVTLLQ